MARKLIESGRIPRDEEIVLCITGNGLKTQDAVFSTLAEPDVIKPTLAEFEQLSCLIDFQQSAFSGQLSAVS